MTTPRLRREVDLLFPLRLVEPAGATPYRLTALGAEVLRVVREAEPAAD